VKAPHMLSHDAILQEMRLRRATRRASITTMAGC
jgi:hypothetical protein